MEVGTIKPIIADIPARLTLLPGTLLCLLSYQERYF